MFYHFFHLIFLSLYYLFSSYDNNTNKNMKFKIKTTMEIPWNLGRLPLVRTGRPDQSICKENSTFNQHCPARSVYFYIVCIAVMRVERKLSKEAYFIFKMTGPTGQFGLLVSALSLLRSRSGRSHATLPVPTGSVAWLRPERLQRRLLKTKTPSKTMMMRMMYYSVNDTGIQSFTE